MKCMLCGRKINRYELVRCYWYGVKHENCAWQGQWKENGGIDALEGCENKKPSFVFNGNW
jgi:hypothetical protein